MYETSPKIRFDWSGPILQNKSQNNVDRIIDGLVVFDEVSFNNCASEQVHFPRKKLEIFLFATSVGVNF